MLLVRAIYFEPKSKYHICIRRHRGYMYLLFTHNFFAKITCPPVWQTTVQQEIAMTVSDSIIIRSPPRRILRPLGETQKTYKGHFSERHALLVFKSLFREKLSA